MNKRNKPLEDGKRNQWISQKLRNLSGRNLKYERRKIPVVNMKS